MRLLDYECKTTFWSDFSIAERFGAEAVRDTYKRAKAEWERDRVYGIELSMVLNHKIGIGIVSLVLNLAISMANCMRSCGKNAMSGCWITGRVRI